MMQIKVTLLNFQKLKGREKFSRSKRFRINCLQGSMSSKMTDYNDLVGKYLKDSIVLRNLVLYEQGLIEERHTAQYTIK